MPTISGPCRVCGVRIQRETLADLFCGPACRTLHATRQVHNRPGDPYYSPVTPEGRTAHRIARRTKRWA